MKFNEFLHHKIPGCENFYWREVLYLPQWRVYVFPDDQQYINLIRVTNKLQAIRDWVNNPIVITSGLRPLIYNDKIRGSLFSNHIVGAALDFRVKNISSNTIRKSLIAEDKLEELDLYMEDLPNASWVHIQILPTKSGTRFFKP